MKSGLLTTSRALAIGVVFAIVAVTAQNIANSSRPPETVQQEIKDRDKDSNGLTVSRPKIFDDSLLQQMLNAAEARLASLQALDQTGISSHVGSVTGASQEVKSFGLSVQGPSTGLAGTNPPEPTTSLPSSPSVSASDVLNEQMQLTYDIANLHLMLEGSLSDRTTNAGGKKVVKPRTTVGFSIAVSPDKRYKDAVAVVEVVVEPNATADLSAGEEAPVIASILPREKTYNVAAITDHSASIGGGVATQIVGVSGSFLTGRKTYYVVKDQDTLALTLPVNAANKAGFLWQFRPVLGQEYVQAGLKQTFVQLAFPSPASAETLGYVSVRSYWRRYDQRHGLVKEVIKGSARDLGRVAIASADLRQDVALDRKGMEDLGNGQMLVTVEMGTLAGSYVRIGKTILKSGSPGFSSEYRRLRFVAPLSDLATKRTVLVSRDGTETPILLQDESITPAKPPMIQDLKAVALDETTSLLTAQVSFPADNQTFPMVLVIGDKVFGYSDAPIDVAESHVSGDRCYQTLKVAVPTAFLMAHSAVTVKPLMVDSRYAATKLLTDPSAQLEHLVLLAQDSKQVRYLLLGGRLKNVKVILPSEVALQSVGSGSDDATVRLVQIPIGVAKNTKKIVLQRPDERPFLVSLPAVATPDSKPKELKVEERITVGTDEAVIVGDHVDGITRVLFGKKSLRLEKAEKSARVKGLRAAGATATAGTKELTLVAKKGPSKTIPLEVVNSKVETVAR